MEYIICFTCGAVLGVFFTLISGRRPPKQELKEPENAAEDVQEETQAQRERIQWDNMMKFNGRKQND